jgi:hypothetical protein
MAVRCGPAASDRFLSNILFLLKKYENAISVSCEVNEKSRSRYRRPRKRWLGVCLTATLLNTHHKTSKKDKMTAEIPDPAEPLALLWDAVLSRQPRSIQAAYLSLAPAAQTALSAHLQRMVSEEGWHPEQQKSAQAALDAIRDLKP